MTGLLHVSHMKTTRLAPPTDVQNFSPCKHSNRPAIRQLPASINKSISTLSSDKQVVDNASQTYQNALGHSNFSPSWNTCHVHSNHAGTGNARDIIWFNPPFSKNVKTNIARSFLKLSDTHCPAGHK